MDYTTDGLDSFLSRSIDELAQINLSSPGPQSTAFRYDSAQVSGMLGDTLQLGKIHFNGAEGNITINDGQNDFFLVGEDGESR